MIALKLAYRNLMGAGLRTFLNVSVLSFAFVLIIFFNGLMDGWHRESRTDTIAWEAGQGQLWHPALDLYDPLTLQDAHAELDARTTKLVRDGELTPILIVPATAYPQGRMEGILLKGIDPMQKILELPSASLQPGAACPAMIGKRAAKNMKLREGDRLLVRWRDVHGTFDAKEVTIVKVFDNNVATVDNGQVWLPIDTLRSMTTMPAQATLLVASKTYGGGNLGVWKWKDLAFLLADLDNIVKAKKTSGTILQMLLLFIALLAIFDTQVLSIFRRQREIGTYIALGMTRWQVVGIFTVEGAAHSVMAALLGAVWGIPLMLWIGHTGINFGMNDIGIAMRSIIYPYYSIGLIVSTTVIVILAATIVSYIPARRIAKMKPTDALKGKLQ
jgi:ABC-type lipoprotein release transport system permease subunit